jgi:hypothetical protein
MTTKNEVNIVVTNLFCLNHHCHLLHIRRSVIMGINGAHTLTYSIKCVSVQQLYSIGIYLYNKNHSAIIKRPPTIYIDASWVIRQCNMEACRVGYLIRMCNLLVTNGFCIVIVCDGAECHYSKRATTKRLAESFKNRIKLNRSNTFLMGLLDKKTRTDSLQESAHIESAIMVVAGKVTTLQAAVKKPT